MQVTGNPSSVNRMTAADRHVFVSYSHADDVWLERLRVHLRPLVRRGALDLWDDSRISPGQVWRDEITKALARAHVAILLISADFLASEFVVDNELPPLLQRAAHNGLLILPLIVSPCLFVEHAELSRFQTVNSPDKPLSGMSRTEAESALASLARSVDRYFGLVAARPGPDAIPVVPARPDDGASSIAAMATGVTATRRPEWRGSEHGPLVVDRPINLGFDSSAPDGVPIGWFNSFGHVSGVSTDYGIRVARRSEDRAAGTCVVLEKATGSLDEFGSLMQRCPGRQLARRTVRLEGELRAEAVAGWGGLWIRADAEDRPNLFFDNMARRPLTGTTAWARYFIDAPLPDNTDWLNYGIVLSGPGRLFADNIRLLVWTSRGGWEDV